MDIIALDTQKYSELYYIVEKELDKLDMERVITNYLNALHIKYPFKYIDSNGSMVVDKFYEALSVHKRFMPAMIYKIYMDNIFRYVLEEDTLETLHITSNNFFTSELNIRISYIAELANIAKEYYIVGDLDETDLENLVTEFLNYVLSDIYKNEVRDSINIEIVKYYYLLKEELKPYIDKHIHIIGRYGFELYRGSLIFMISQRAMLNGHNSL
jgi:hypothetical protein